MASRDFKIVPSSKTSEWAGLDRIGPAVHEMRCVWREQTKDDIGIDGEIELTEPRPDGVPGRIGTAKYIKVQAKSGSSYIKFDSLDSFETPVSKSDLLYWNNSNVPVIFIIYHPEDDKLYWLDIKKYISDTPGILEEPHRLIFQKSKTVFSSDVYDEIWALCNKAQPRVSRDVSDLLYINVLEVLKLPAHMYMSSVAPDKRAMFRHRLDSDEMPYVYKAGTLFTLTDPTRDKVVEFDSVKKFSLNEWLETVGPPELLSRLLNQALHSHLTSKGLCLEEKGRLYFFPATAKTQNDPNKVSWQSSKSGKRHRRTVVGYYEYKQKFYKHLGLEAKFRRYGQSWGLFLHPNHYYSVDGQFKRWAGEVARSQKIQFRSREYNQHVLNHMLFWAYFIAGGLEKWTLEYDDEVLVEISGQVPRLEACFGVPFKKS